MKEIGMAAILFRFEDINNYYSVEIDPTGYINLNKKWFGNKENLGYYETEIEPDSWYKFDIGYEENNIKVYLR